ncbi:MAG: DNA-binding protein [Bacteroidetes bacterium]|nr:MAG: DNA-binding protein [Bacteroidota bacterium]
MQNTTEQIRRLAQEIRTLNSQLKPQQIIQDHWIDGIEVQNKLHISEKTLYRHRRSGRLPYSKVRGKIYYKSSDIKNLLEKNYRVERPKCTCCFIHS